jgi:hypothetical protein
MTTFTLAQTMVMVRKGEASPWPALVGLFWTSIAVAAVLFENALIEGSSHWLGR